MKIVNVDAILMVLSTFCQKINLRKMDFEVGLDARHLALESAIYPPYRTNLRPRLRFRFRSSPLDSNRPLGRPTAHRPKLVVSQYHFDSSFAALAAQGRLYFDSNFAAPAGLAQ